ncbi:34375_t:CDS:2, partial [Gigaspora margarita]
DHIRTCMRIFWLNIEEKSESDHFEKEKHMKLLLAYVVAFKHHIRSEYGTNYPDFKDILLIKSHSGKLIFIYSYILTRNIRKDLNSEDYGILSGSLEALTLLLGRLDCVSSTPFPYGFDIDMYDKA